MKLKTNILEINETNDIKYKAPLSYRYLRIIAWIAFAIGQIAIVLSFAYEIMHTEEKPLTDMATASIILNAISCIAMPLFMLANVAIVINSRDRIKKQLLIYGLGALGIYAAFLFFYFHYLFTIVNAFLGDPALAEKISESAIKTILKNHSSFNIFVDLFLWTLCYFFLTYEPRLKIFKGKKIYIFRSLIALPIIYVLSSTFLKGADNVLFTIPAYLYPLLSTKPPLLFLAFILICMFIKHREIYFRKNGKTKKEYRDFLKTNTASLNFSKHTSIIFAIISATDLIILLTLLLVPNLLSSKFGNIVIAMGFTNCVPLFLVIPFILLFSYNKTHDPKYKMMDIIIPLGGILLVVLSIVETIFQILMNLL